MTTATQAFNIIKARLIAAGLTYSGSNVLLRWQNEQSDPIPSEAAFVFTEFLTEPSAIVGFGGGSGANRYRNPARCDFYVFIPQNWGLDPATDIAETIAALFRSYRDTDISVFEVTIYPGGDGASIKPPGWDSAVTNYFFAVAEASLYFDLIG